MQPLCSAHLYNVCFLWHHTVVLDTWLKQVTNLNQNCPALTCLWINLFSIPTYTCYGQMDVTEPEMSVSNLSHHVKLFQYDSCDFQDRDECTESPSICGERIKCLNTPGKLYSLIIKE